MPYSGMTNDPATGEKLERCVQRVMRQGHDKSSAIAICRASMKKESPMSNKAKLARQRRLRQETDIAAKRRKADEAQAVLEDEEPEVDEPEPDDKALTEAETVEKYMNDMAEQSYAIGASDFDELEAERSAQEMAQHAMSMSGDFMMLAQRLMHNPEI